MFPSFSSFVFFPVFGTDQENGANPSRSWAQFGGIGMGVFFRAFPSKSYFKNLYFKIFYSLIFDFRFIYFSIHKMFLCFHAFLWRYSPETDCLSASYSICSLFSSSFGTCFLSAKDLISQGFFLATWCSVMLPVWVGALTDWRSSCAQ